MRVVLAVALLRASLGKEGCHCRQSLPRSVARHTSAGGSVSVLVEINGSELHYPVDYGTEVCAAHDESLDPRCNVTVIDPPGWCSLPWCWVDPDCDASPEESLSFPGMYYSYAHCGVAPGEYHLAMYPPHFSAKNDAANTRPLRVIVEDDEPEGYVKDGEVVGGFCKELLDGLAETIQLSYPGFQVEYTPKGAGTLRDNWETAVTEGEYHVFCMRRPTSPGVRNFEITQPVVVGGGFSLIGRAAKAEYMHGWARPFKLDLWMGFSALMLLPTLGLFLLRVNKMETPEGRREQFWGEMSWRERIMAAGDAVFLSLSAMLGQPEMNGKTWIGKAFFIMLAFAALIFHSSYTANLAVFLQEQSLLTAVNGPEDFAVNSKLEVCEGFAGGGAMGGSASKVMQNYFDYIAGQGASFRVFPRVYDCNYPAYVAAGRPKDDDCYVTDCTGFPENCIGTIPRALLDSLRMGRCDAIVKSTIHADQFIYQQQDLEQCEFTSLGSPFLKENYVLPVRKGELFLLELLNDALTEAAAGQELARLYRKHWKDGPCSSKAREEKDGDVGAKQLSFGNMAGFILTAAVTWTCIIAMLLARLLLRWIRQSKASDAEDAARVRV